MTRFFTRASAVVLLAMSALVVSPRALAQTGDAAPIIVVETSKGAFSFQTFPEEAPLTVAHIVALVKSGFYDGQRVHRALPGFVVQFGDPQSKDLSKRSLWGRGDAASSGHPIGFAEVTAKRNHVKGAVGMAHLGDPAKADSQMYITLADRPDLDLRYVVFGQVVTGVDVPAELQVGDTIKRVYVQ
jgi:peptidyl-prolyl cis-trans isomerase B (cyclophilin B)